MNSINTIRSYEMLPEDSLVDRVRALKDKLGNDLCLLAHLYQRREIGKLADFVGDSYGLSRSASTVEGGRYIVFCGVRFMAESARILARRDQWVIHPDPEAGCPMADMASLDQVKRAWDRLGAETEDTIVPVTYINSTADIKAFCGERGGTICTSSNALRSIQWAFEKGQKVFFLPDEHLGRNTAIQSGIPAEEIAVWDPHQDDGGDSENYRDARVILWRGYCPVHQKFTPRDIDHVRRFYPGALVIVHPECPREVVEKADAVGSTDFIRKFVAKTRIGDRIFIGTELNLIQNLAKEYPDRFISKLHRSLCLTMYQITMGRLLYTLENLETVERVELPEEIKHFARVALERMLSLSS